MITNLIVLSRFIYDFELTLILPTRFIGPPPCDTNQLNPYPQPLRHEVEQSHEFTQSITPILHLDNPTLAQLEIR